MKKTLKSILAAMLAIILAFGATTAAFAAENLYVNGGELKIGENTVTVPEDDYFAYYTVNIENEGYYHLSYDGDKAVMWGTYGYLDEDGEYWDFEGVASESGSQLFYLESEENIIGLYFDRDATEKTETVNFDYLGAEITDIKAASGTEYGVILDYDLWGYGGNGNYEYWAYDVDLYFGEDKALNFEEVYVGFKADGKLEEGVNDIVYKFIGDSEEACEIPGTIEAYNITHYIEKIEVNNPEDITVIEYYDGYCDIAYGDKASLTVTFADGKSQTLAMDEDSIDIRSGNPGLYYVYCYVDEDGHFCVDIANHEYVNIAIEKKSATAAENFGALADDYSYEFRWYFYRVGAYFNDIKNQDSVADTLRAIGCFVSYMNNNFLYIISDLFEDIMLIFRAL